MRSARPIISATCSFVDSNSGNPTHFMTTSKMLSPFEHVQKARRFFLSQR
jgi:hypothetical protein